MASMKRFSIWCVLLVALAGCSSPQKASVAVAPPPVPPPKPKKKLPPIIVQTPNPPPMQQFNPPVSTPATSLSAPVVNNTPSRSQLRSNARRNPAPPIAKSNTRTVPQNTPRRAPAPTAYAPRRYAPVDPGYVNTPAPAPNSKPVDWRVEAIDDIDATGNLILTTSNSATLSQIAAGCDMTAYEIRESIPPVYATKSFDMRTRAVSVAAAYSLLATTARDKAKGFLPASVARHRVNMARDLARGKQPRR
jgi:hypothetical protein